MKLSELSLRDHIAIGAVAGLLTRPDIRNAKVLARKAYRVADAMLIQMDVRDHEIETLTRRAEIAERTVEILRGNPTPKRGYANDRA